jgi:hypothetical protein
MEYVKLKIKGLMAMVFVVQSCFCQTNFFPYLQCGGQSYTNVTISSVTPATAVLVWEGGGEQVPMTNLPKRVQKQYGYDPQKAQEYLAAIEARKAATQARANENAAALADAQASLGPPQRIRILKCVYDWQYQVVLPDDSIANISIHNLPTEISAFVHDLTSTQAIVNADKGVVYSDLSEGGVFMTRQQLKANNEGHLQALLPLVEQRTTIRAVQTVFFVQGVRQWEFVSMAGAQTVDDASPGRPLSSRFGPGRAVSTRDGIPESTYNIIAAKAAREWPNDFDMQQYVINKQVVAYKQLHQMP